VTRRPERPSRRGVNQRGRRSLHRDLPSQARLGVPRHSRLRRGGGRRHWRTMFALFRRAPQSRVSRSVRCRGVQEALKRTRSTMMSPLAAALPRTQVSPKGGCVWVASLCRDLQPSATCADEIARNPKDSEPRGRFVISRSPVQVGSPAPKTLAPSANVNRHTWNRHADCAAVRLGSRRAFPLGGTSDCRREKTPETTVGEQ
jgi:hypothetical protein